MEIRISVNLNQPVLQEDDRIHQCLDAAYVIAGKDVCTGLLSLTTAGAMLSIASHIDEDERIITNL
jgi:hypothetical protein